MPVNSLGIPSGVFIIESLVVASVEAINPCEAVRQIMRPPKDIVLTKLHDSFAESKKLKAWITQYLRVCDHIS